MFSLLYGATYPQFRSLCVACLIMMMLQSLLFPHVNPFPRAFWFKSICITNITAYYYHKHAIFMAPYLTCKEELIQLFNPSLTAKKKKKLFGKYTLMISVIMYLKKPELLLNVFRNDGCSHCSIRWLCQ